MRIRPCKCLRLHLGKRGGIIPALNEVAAACAYKLILLLRFHALANKREIKGVHKRDNTVKQLSAALRIRKQKQCAVKLHNVDGIIAKIAEGGV